MTEPMSCNEWSKRLESGIHSLSPADRHAFEAHIRVCSMCALMFTKYGKITMLLCHLPVPELPTGLPPLLLQQWEEEERNKVDAGIETGMLLNVIEENILPKQNNANTDSTSNEESSTLPPQSVRAFLEEKQLDEEETRKQKELQQHELQRRQDALRESESRSQANQGHCVDQTLICRECGTDFTFTAGEQEFYQSKGLMNRPSRCPSCRANRRAASGAGTRSEHGPRQMYTIVCAECGCETQVPFLPRNDRPVYCSNCYNTTRIHGPLGPAKKFTTLGRQ